MTFYDNARALHRNDAAKHRSLLSRFRARLFIGHWRSQIEICELKPWLDDRMAFTVVRNHRYYGGKASRVRFGGPLLP